MKGVVFAGNRKIEIKDFPDPKPGADDVAFKIRATGVCGQEVGRPSSRTPPGPTKNSTRRR